MAYPICSATKRTHFYSSRKKKTSIITWHKDLQLLHPMFKASSYKYFHARLCFKPLHFHFGSHHPIEANLSLGHPSLLAAI